jgi:hypothetical protein
VPASSTAHSAAQAGRRSALHCIGFVVTKIITSVWIGFRRGANLRRDRPPVNPPGTGNDMRLHEMARER